MQTDRREGKCSTCMPVNQMQLASLMLDSQAPNTSLKYRRTTKTKQKHKENLATEMPFQMCALCSLEGTVFLSLILKKTALSLESFTTCM